jgi:hypothetical protein
LAVDPVDGTLNYVIALLLSPILEKELRGSRAEHEQLTENKSLKRSADIQILPLALQ